MALVIAETGFRVYHAVVFRDLSSIEAGDRNPLIQPGREMPLRDIIQISGNRRIVYELIPSSSYLYQNVKVVTNDRGFRDRDYSEQKTAGTKRIVGLGDSIMFGYGVEEEETFLYRLEEHLNRSETTKHEVINTGVPGYNTVMEVETLKEKLDVSQIDIIVISCVGNDFDIPNFIVERPSYFRLRPLFMTQHFKRRPAFQLGDAPLDYENQRYQRDPDKVPEQYRDMVGESSWKNAMEELAVLRDDWGFKVFVLWDSPTRDVPPIVPRLSHELGFTYVEAKSSWSEYVATHPDAKWIVAENDKWHPSAAGHHAIADALIEAVTPEM